MQLIDDFLKQYPDISRSSLMVDCTIQAITALQDDKYMSLQQKKGKVMCHIAEISNLTNSIRQDDYVKEQLQKEVVELWQFLK